MNSARLIEHFCISLREAAAAHGSNLDLQSSDDAGLRPDERLGEEFVAYMRKLGVQMDDAFFGLADGRCPAEAPQFGFELMLLCSTLGEALDRFCRFYAIATSGLCLTLDSDRKDAWITIAARDPERDPRHFLIEWYAARITSMSQWLTGHEMPEMIVEFSHDRALPPEAYVASLGQHVSFGQPVSRVILPRRYLGMRVIRTVEDEAELQSKTRYDPEHMSISKRRWAGLVQTILRDILLRQQTLPTMDGIARDLGVSGQTLRRHLQAEETTYRAIKADARRDVVLTSLADPSLSVSEIAALAGFSESNGLLRAMKSWTGKSLSEYRRDLLEQDS